MTADSLRLSLSLSCRLSQALSLSQLTVRVNCVLDVQDNSFDMWVHTSAHMMYERQRRSEEQRQGERAREMHELETSLAGVDDFRRALMAAISRERERARVEEGGGGGG